ncbi:hypothetical protein M3196_00215 [Fictibacillus nanhaiensis]|uniref:hypothetical protein n=1 Tax=Fictibacillus nanhaiensis TaxID=742169 RepID=UPI00203C6D44|nr:hypothetical protein [Fictibacillus nanhaiensis]MCM3730093.1 hypothetical protein [Fictibacillus nanhaiensis]
MAKNYWNKKELLILNNCFEEMEWEKFIVLLANKTEKQILKKANNLGLKREPEEVDCYYDEKERGWVKKSRHFGSEQIHPVSAIFPCEKGFTFEEVHNRFVEHATNVFVKSARIKYRKFLEETYYPHNEKLFRLFFDIEFYSFCREQVPNYEERIDEIVSEYKNKD